MDRTGLYGLFDLDGAPPDADAAAILGVPPGADGSDGIAAAVDLADPDAAQCMRVDGALIQFLGRLDDPAAVAGQLGMPPDTPHTALASAALARFGPSIRTLLHGEWTLAQWDGRALILVASPALRDSLFYAVRGRRIAIGPDLRQLSRIAWVGDRLNPAGLLMALGRSTLRAPGDTRTPVDGIAALAPGAYLTIDRQGVRTAAPITIEADTDWHGDLDDAVAATEALMLNIVRQRMVGGTYTCMLSGGLDSSTIAWATAQMLEPGEQLRFLTSAATPGSGQIDEVAQAAIVAAHLGIAHDPVIAAARPGPYLPDPLLFRDANGPSLDVRHYLYHRFAEHSRALGAATLFDGQFGELTFSNSLPLHRPPSWWRAARRWLPVRSPAPAEAFHVLLAPHWLDAPPVPLRDALSRRPDPMALPEPGALWGIIPGFAKAMRAPASLDLGRVRVAMPFRDARLIALFAGFPAAMLYPETGARTPARRLLADKLPESIRLRGKGPGFAPDYVARLESEAEAARAQIALFRRAGADEWIDLDALDRGLARAARGATAHYHDATRVQLTALAGAFIAWWRGVL
jgi:hypothetical protein